MTQVWEYIKIALMNIRSNKGRSILTMLGIIIGISSVIMIISIGNGVKSGINGELNSMAGGQIAVYSSNTAENGTEVVFTEEDMDAGESSKCHGGNTVLEFQRKRHRQKGNF